ncbi:MAG: Lrp/AsnC family transcriptional regulator [Nanoarchaeota archaeon]|nr:Lrp/AsnC family transcriptional regulator [Nanoarchaeota archaeon]
MEKRKVKLDKKDWRLLYELEKNARLPLQGLAKKLGTSKQLIRYMLNKFEEQKIVQAYTAIIDSSRLGYSTYRLYIKFSQVNTPEKREEFYHFLASIPETTIVNSIDMRWDAGLIIAVQSVDAFYAVFDRIMQKRAFIDEYNAAVYSPVHHFTRSLLSPEPTNEVPAIRVMGGHEKVECEESDVKILQELAKNVRQPIVRIAQKVKLGAQHVSRRISAMEKNGVIQGYRPLLNWKLLGYSYYKIDLKLKSFSHNKELFSYCHHHPQIIQVNQTIGGGDFEFEVFAKSDAEFHSILKEILEKFSDTVINYDYFIVGKPYKETFMAF